AQSRARKAGMRFALRPGFAVRLFEQQEGRCAVSGIEFNLDRFPDALVKPPFAPSIDRRVSRRHYTENNVRLVCVAVNFGMGQWGEEVFMTLARAAVERESHAARVRPELDGGVAWEAKLRDRIKAATEMLPLLPPEAQKKH